MRFARDATCTRVSVGHRVRVSRPVDLGLPSNVARGMLLYEPIRSHFTSLIFACHTRFPEARALYQARVTPLFSGAGANF